MVCIKYKFTFESNPSKVLMTSSEIKQHPVIVYDGVCVLCNGFVKWLIKNDNNKVFRFSTLQSDLGVSLKEGAGVQGDTVLLVFKNKTYVKSDVALQTMRHLGGWWSVLAIVRFVPRFLRDTIYDLVAKNRYRWFGEHESCLMPSPEIKDRFL